MMNWFPSYANRWKNAKHRKLSPEAKLVFDYLTSNPSTTSSGIYPLEIEEAAADTGIPLAALPACLEELAAPRRTRSSFIKFDGNVVWVVGQWKHAVNQSGNHKNSVGLDFNRSPRFCFWPEFFRRYPDVLQHCLTARHFSGRDAFIRIFEKVSAEPELTPSTPYQAPKISPLTQKKSRDKPLAEGLKGLRAQGLIEGSTQGLIESAKSPLSQRKKEVDIGGLGSQPNPTPPTTEPEEDSLDSAPPDEDAPIEPTTNEPCGPVVDTDLDPAPEESIEDPRPNPRENLDPSGAASPRAKEQTKATRAELFGWFEHRPIEEIAKKELFCFQTRLVKSKIDGIINQDELENIMDLVIAAGKELDAQEARP